MNTQSARTNQNSQLPPHLQMENNQSEIVVEKYEDKKLRAVVFVGDVLTMRQKESIFFRLGGRLYLDARTVPNNIASSCAITPLRQGMMSQHRNMIDPKQHINGGYVSSYIATNVWNPSSARFENIEVGKSGASAGLLFKPVYPAQEIGRIIGRGDGTVEVPFVESAADIREAQMFFFPNWIKIASGTAFLPPTLRQLKEHLQNRIEQTDSVQLQEIGKAFLASCQQFRLYGSEYIATQSKLIKEAEKIQGVLQVYDEIGERFFKYLELTRQDSLIQDFAKQTADANSSQSEIAKAISLMTQLLARNEAATGALINQPAPAAKGNNAPPAFSDLAGSEIIPGKEENKSADGADSDSVSCEIPKTSGEACQGNVTPGTRRCPAHKNSVMPEK